MVYVQHFVKFLKQTGETDWNWLKLSWVWEAAESAMASSGSVSGSLPVESSLAERLDDARWTS